MRTKPRFNRSKQQPLKRAFVLDEDDRTIDDEYPVMSWMIHQPAADK